MSSDDSKSRYYTQHADLFPDTQEPAAKENHPHHTPAPLSDRYSKYQVGSIPDDNTNNFIKEGKILAHTINAPFTSIPLIPAATPVLRKIDKATGQDLGFTYKGSLSSEKNAQGNKDLIYKIDYIGVGIMSSKFNVQVAPVAAKIEHGAAVYQGFGCNLSTLASPIGLVHERLGAKATVTDCNSSSESISLALEASYQKSSSFKPLSTATFGYFFGNGASFRIPEEYIPLYKRIMADLPSWEESKVALEHIAPAVPFIMKAEAISAGVELAEAALKSAAVSAKSMLKTAATLEINGINIITNQHSKHPLPATAKSTSTTPDNNASRNTATPSANRISQTPVTNSQPYSPSFSVQVKSGDSLWRIAARETGDANHYKAIAEKNHIQNPDIIHPAKDKKLVIPGYQKSNEEKATYTVSAEDTLDSIGKRTGHPWQEILALNKNSLKNNPDRIFPGQELLIPDNHDHLLHHPVVQARIRENLAKQTQPDPER